MLLHVKFIHVSGIRSAPRTLPYLNQNLLFSSIYFTFSISCNLTINIGTISFFQIQLGHLFLQLGHLTYFGNLFKSQICCYPLRPHKFTVLDSINFAILKNYCVLPLNVFYLKNMCVVNK